MRHRSSLVVLLGSVALGLSLLMAPAQAASSAGTTLVLPPMSQPGTGTASSTSAKWVVQATFTTSLRRTGRTVQFYRLRNGTWSKACRVKQDRNGRAICRTADKTSRWKASTAGSKRWTSWSPVPTWSRKHHTEFSSRSMPAGWSHRVLKHRGGSRMCSSSEKSAVTFTGSTVQLRTQVHKKGRPSGCTAKAANGKYYHFANGHISTQGKQTFGPTGMAAARIKFSAKRGSHGAFWAQDTKNLNAGGREIDVIESFGSTRSNAFKSFVHTTKGSSQASPAAIARAMGKPSTWHNRYRVFSVEWTPKQFVFRIDGVETHRTTRYATSSPRFLVLSNLSSDWELPLHDTSRNTMHVDWVTYWQK